ncbi:MULTISPECIES: transglycosylase family protein [unclassified Streptomyces]|uniref:LysM peptidoglycan-binding domain-containing protein n=1 Tax=unclassified Streptomyces TaxID=2593676 RepID=UPI000DB95864|nr:MULTISPECIES: transglycosylase family protein [unclassified Streptomyces]MYT72606.1 LysM peptidoglycan-binding domain-containing protein [Streptomyces sp. SID8367]RAJ79463.1 LysM domain-containing protein [Streptomyces sp. PsTaAH-137]
MLSGNGRHRRPRQAPALVVAAGVTGSAIAIPLLGATGAGAATATTWDKVAECESGGQWSLDAGDGYYGGLQFSQEVWEQYGGLDYAPRADQASRSQQIAVAEKVLDDKGPSAWPSCSLTAGLTKGDGSADVDPGATTTPQPSDTADSDSGSDADAGDKNHDESGTSDKASGASSGKASGTASDDASDDAASDPSSDPSGEASDEPSADSSADTGGNSAGDDASAPSGTASPNSPAATDSSGSADSGDASSNGRHRGDPAADDDADSRTQDGRHASRAEERDDAAYVVRSGDNLWDIADAHDVQGGWAALYDANKKTVGTDPDLILPGQSLDLGLESVEK